MKTTQYTIRAVPQNLDKFLRQQAKARGKSLNQTVLDYIEQATKLDMQDADDDFGWLIGAGALDDGTLQALAEFKQQDKRLNRL